MRDTPHDPAVPLLGDYPRDLKHTSTQRHTHTYTHTHTRMFIAALFTTAKNWKQPNPQANEPTKRGLDIQWNTYQ